MGSVLIASGEDLAQWRPLPEGRKLPYGTTHFDPKTGSIIDRTTLEINTGTTKGHSGKDGALSFIDMERGDEVLRLILPGPWTTWSCDRLAKSVDDSATSTVIFKDDSHSFFRVSGNPPTIKRFTTDQSIWSGNLVQVGEVVPFLSDEGSLIAYSIASRSSSELAEITHNRGDLLPFFSLLDGSFVVGTSFGMVYLISSDAKLLAKRKIGKRVSTHFSVSDGILCCGSASGEIVGMRVSQ